MVRKSSNFELSSRFFDRLKIFIGQGSLYSLEPIFQTPHYQKNVLGVTRSVLTSVTIAEGVLYTLTAEVDTKRYESEEGEALRRAVASLTIKPKFES